jgi:hypothetical protein
MWHPNSPLKKYMEVFPKRSKFYFQTWNRLGPIYSRYGKEVILQKPLSYLRYFALPNAKAVLIPDLEIYATYMEVKERDTIPAVVTRYYKYNSNKMPRHYPALYTVVFNPMLYMWIGLNVLFPLLGLFYLIRKRYQSEPALFNHALICIALLFVGNFLFITLLAPSVFRYHVFVLTLSFPFIIYLVQSFYVHNPVPSTTGKFESRSS